jgi:hypothetical protein
MNLDIAQYVQSQKEDITITYIKSDLNRAFIKILGSDLLLSELGVLISNSQEHARQLEMMRQFALENNTAGMSPVDVADVIMMNNPAEIRRQLEASYNKLLKQQEDQQAQAQQQHEQEIQVEMQRLKQDENDKALDRENNLNIARIKAGADIINSKSDVTFPDTEQQANNQSQRNIAEANVSLKQQKLDLDKQRLNADIQHREAQHAHDQAKTAADLQIQKEHVEAAKIMKGKKLP